MPSGGDRTTSCPVIEKEGNKFWICICSKKKWKKFRFCLASANDTCIYVGVIPNLKLHNTYSNLRPKLRIVFLHIKVLQRELFFLPNHRKVASQNFQSDTYSRITLNNISFQEYTQSHEMYICILQSPEGVHVLFDYRRIRCDWG